MSGSTSPQIPATFSYQQFNTIISGVELLYDIGKRVSIAMQNRPCDFLTREASTAFAKMIMSLLGFLRFIPSSRFHAKEGDLVIDLSSASVMARQVMEDAISYFYLSEENLTREEKEFREYVWRFHGASEALATAKFGNLSHSELTPLAVANRKSIQELIEKHPLFAGIEAGRKGRIKKGDEGHVLHDSQILERRGIQTDVYNLGRKVLSNFAHFSALSHQMMVQTNADWMDSCPEFLPPAMYAVNFASEAVAVFLAAFPEAALLVRDDEKAAVDNLRSWLRTPFEPRIVTGDLTP
jgi:hypothetical protein